MGPMSTPQKVMGATLLGAVALWMFGDLIGVSAVVAAMMGLCVLLLSGVLEWQVCIVMCPVILRPLFRQPIFGSKIQIADYVLSGVSALARR